MSPEPPSSSSGKSEVVVVDDVIGGADVAVTFVVVVAPVVISFEVVVAPVVISVFVIPRKQLALFSATQAFVLTSNLVPLAQSIGTAIPNTQTRNLPQSPAWGRIAP